LNKKKEKSFDNLFLDFNNLTEFLSRNNYLSRLIGNGSNDFILNSTYQVRNVHNDKFFYNLIKKIIDKYNLYGAKIDVDLFVGFTQGAVSIIHEDKYDVILYALAGETMYIVDKKQYILEPGDLIKINAGEIHQAIGISPRIVLSLGVHERTDI